MTDTDIGRRLTLSDEVAWLRLIESSPHIRSFLPDRESLGPIQIYPSGTRWTSCSTGENWLAVGDAASIFDPLSSLGITKAIRSGIFAAYTIGDLLLKHDESSLSRYHYFLKNEFSSYLETRRSFYSHESRWAKNDFWRRRTAVGTNWSA